MIYREGMATGIATFEIEAPEWSVWDAGHLPHSRVVVRTDGAIGGWAALSPVSWRTCYSGVAEVSVYVAAEYRGQGLGRLLLTALIGESEAHGIWTLQAGIFAQNRASIALHERMDFRQIGVRERIAQRDGLWHDTVQMERRSSTVGL
jgi:phosphinothricin acetyltransferase